MSSTDSIPFKKLDENEDEETAIKNQAAATLERKKTEKIKFEEIRGKVIIAISAYAMPVIFVVLTVLVVRCWWRVRALQEEGMHDDQCACSLPETQPVTFYEKELQLESNHTTTTALRAAYCERSEQRAPYWLLPMMFAVKKFMNSLIMGDDYLKDAEPPDRSTFSGQLKWFFKGIGKTIVKVIILVVAANSTLKDFLQVWGLGADDGLMAGLECFVVTWSLSANVAAMVAVLFSLPKEYTGVPEFLVLAYATMLGVIYGFPLVAITALLMLPVLCYAFYLSILVVWASFWYFISFVIAVLTFAFALAYKVVIVGCTKLVMLVATIFTLGFYRGCTGNCCDITDEPTRDDCEWNDFWAYWKGEQGQEWFFWLSSYIPGGATSLADAYSPLYLFYCLTFAAAGHEFITSLYSEAGKTNEEKNTYRYSWMAVICFPCFLNFFVPIAVRWFFMAEDAHTGLEMVYDSRSIFSYLGYTAGLLDSVGLCAYSAADACIDLVMEHQALTPFKTFMQTFVDMLWSWI